MKYKMEGKLRKRDEHYFFWSSDWNPDKEEGFVANTTNLLPTKLSLKSCQAIENGYDLDELVNRAFDNMGYHSTVTPHEEKQFKLGYMVAFREVLEILGNKRFDEEDILIAIEGGYHAGINYNVDEEEQGDKIIRLKDNLIVSLQQTEWDVEIEMEPYAVCDFEDFINDGKTHIIETKLRPRLDADGCLILRRK